MFYTRTLHYKGIDNTIFDILLPKLNPITAGIFYRRLNLPNFIKLLVKKFSHAEILKIMKYFFSVISTLIFYKTVIIT